MASVREGRPSRWLQVFSTPRFHLSMAYIWMLLIIPTLIWWKSSILWVASMSLYANFIGHWSAYQAARAERTADRAEGKADGC